jgi:hypothetical protein
MPTEGVVASHEDKEAARWKSRQIGRARRSSQDSAHFEDSPTETHFRNGQAGQKETDKEAKACS